LIGSTEWGEEHADELPGKVAVYVNRESYHQGEFQASGSHALQPLVNEVAGAVAFPREEGTTVQQRWLGRAEGNTADADEGGTSPVVTENGRTDVRIGALGSGSDYTVFIDHLGIPSLNLGFESPNGVYHSRYDTHHYFVTFGDPDFETGERLAEVVALFLARMANAEVLPFDYRATAETVERYLDEVEAEAERRGVSVDLASVRDASRDFGSAADALQQKVEATLSAAAPRTEDVEALNTLMLDVERGFLTEQGLPGRPWFRHQLYAPGYYTGYGVKTLPGIREAIENGDAREATELASRLTASLRAVSARIREVLG
jgi:N-acetylated-alpha-linked acidic dipeptidase